MSEAHKLAAALRGAARTEKMEKAVQDAMRAIQADLQANGGIYPHNGGAVSMAELSRRAGISESSFYKKAPENRALKDMANLWLDSLKKKETVGRMRVKKSLEQRAEDWHQKYVALEQRHIRTELELQSIEAKMYKLTQEHTDLLAQMSKLGKTNITPIKAGKH
jgi:lambda repressor-like predicted transcriptional regulator